MIWVKSSMMCLWETMNDQVRKARRSQGLAVAALVDAPTPPNPPPPSLSFVPAVPALKVVQEASSVPASASALPHPARQLELGVRATPPSSAAYVTVVLRLPYIMTARDYDGAAVFAAINDYYANKPDFSQYNNQTLKDEAPAEELEKIQLSAHSPYPSKDNMPVHPAEEHAGGSRYPSLYLALADDCSCRHHRPGRQGLVRLDRIHSPSPPGRHRSYVRWLHRCNGPQGTSRTSLLHSMDCVEI